MYNSFLKEIFKLSIIGISISLLFLIFAPAQVEAATNIVQDDVPSGVYNQWSWNDVIGWIDFMPEPSSQCLTCPNVNVFNDRIEGYASSSVGFIAFHCSATNPSGVSVCGLGSGNWFVSNDGAGNLAGWAWNDQIGWISFCGNASGGSLWNGSTWVCPTTGATYQVTIETTAGPTEGDFRDWAWNDVVGWISFNCDYTGLLCNTINSINYRVKTSWIAPPPVLADGNLISSIFDTCPAGTPANTNCGSSAINTIMWQGSLPFNTAVRFRIASSNCANGSANPGCSLGGWGITSCGVYDSCFLGDADYTNLNSYYPGFVSAEPGIPIKINPIHNNKRYIRYRIYFVVCNPPDPSCPGSPATPRVDDIILNWSP